MGGGGLTAPLLKLSGGESLSTRCCRAQVKGGREGRAGSEDAGGEAPSLPCAPPGAGYIRRSRSSAGAGAESSAGAELRAKKGEASGVDFLASSSLRMPSLRKRAAEPLDLKKAKDKMKALWALMALLLLPPETLSARVSRTRRELAPGLHERGIRDAGGSYCERHEACCRGRNDGCTVPYLDTICYCDLFCNRTVSDCCPDFWEYCLGIEPPFPVQRVCIRNGNRFPTGATYRDNCNLCTCYANGQWNCEDHACLINADLVDAVNRGNYGWSASNYSQFWGMTLEEGIHHRLGTTKPPTSVMNMNELQMNMEANEVLPRHFNAADKWSGMIHEPLDQGNCAGSWAFSTAAVASDRISIHSMGHMTPALSPQNLLSCNTRHQQGCNGGRVDGAWWYLRRRGVVTDECYPFMHLEKEGALPAPPCMMQSRSTGRGKRQATARCPNPRSHSNEIYQSTPAYRLSSDEKEIMKELMENGPVQAIMEVHEDFFMYRSGIYQHTPVAAWKPENYRRHGTHSVKITGWGEEHRPDGSNQKYWIAANSWGTDWGEHGYFRIARGANECDIETFVVGVWGRVGMEDMHHHYKK